MSATHEKPFTPAKGKKFEAVTVGNVTAKIYRRRRLTVKQKRRWIYEVVDKSAGVRRLRGFSDLTEARKEAHRIVDLTNTQGAAAAKLTGAQLASYGRAVELIRPLGVSLELAAATYAKVWEILGGDLHVEAAKFYAQHRADRIQKRKVAEVVTELIEVRTKRTKRGSPASARYLGDMRARLDRFAQDFAVDISTVTTADVQHWLDALNVSAQTAKNFRTLLHTLFAFSEARGYILKHGNPVKGTEDFSPKGGAIQIFTPDEISKLLKAAKPDFLPFIAIGAFAGLRAAEIERLEWQNVDLAGGFIHVEPETAKTRSRRLVPILPNLAKWLAPYAKHSGKVWKGDSNDLQDARAQLVKDSGVMWKDNALRYSFISYRLADIQNAAQVSLEAGNSPAMVFKHYLKLVNQEAAKEWFAIAPEQPANVVNMPATKVQP